MVKEVEWSDAAFRDRQNIYHYWLHRSGSHSFSEKLEALFAESAKLIAEFPEIGSQTEIPAIRAKVVRTFKLFLYDLPGSNYDCTCVGYPSES